MRLRQSSIAQWLFLAAATSLVLAACGRGGGTSGQGASQAPTTTAAPAAAAATSPPTSSADPLKGAWRTEFTCQDSVRAIQRRLSAKQIHQQVGSWKSFLREFQGWVAEPTKNDPCHGATGTVAVLARFAQGDLALLNAKTGELGASARYELAGDHSIRVNDKEGNLCDPAGGCPVTWEFKVSGDKLTFHVSADAYVVGTWEAAPWVRER